MSPTPVSRFMSVVVTALILGLPPGALGDASVIAMDLIPAPVPETGRAAWRVHLILEGMPVDSRTRRRDAMRTPDFSLDLGFGRVLPAVIDRVVRHDDVGAGGVGVAWSGRVLDGSESAFVLARVGDAIAGALWHSELGVFSILPTAERDALGQRLSLIVESDPEASTACGTDLLMAHEAPAAEGAREHAAHRPSQGTGVPSTPESARQAAAVGASSCDCGDDGSRVDILVVYTSQARD